jgi:hypothetical protein
MNDPETITQPRGGIAYWRNWYQEQKYGDRVEHHVQLWCAANKVAYSPPPIKYAEHPQEFHRFWDEAI